MLIVHLLAGLTVGFLSALWAWAEGGSLPLMILVYVLGGNVGVALSVLTLFVRPERRGGAEGMPRRA